ncbi:MAG TPA: fibronectin type III domain-containing protein [Armatimonadota bacterium]|jgi:hypothetical protein
MLWKLAPGIVLGALAFACTPSVRAAVMTSNVTVTGAGPYQINYILAQDALTLKANVYTAAGSLVVSLDKTGDSNYTTKGPHDSVSGHLPPIDWDGNKQDGSAAPRGTYYAEIVTTGDVIATPTQLSVANFLKGTGATEARNVYGGQVNTNATSPRHNLGYFGVAATNASGTSGLEVVSADSSTVLFPQDGALGTYDYVSASVLSDETLLLGGQAKKKFRNVKATDGSLIADYAAGKVDVRSMQAFGAGASARVYFVDDQTPNGPLTGSVGLLNPVSNTVGTPIYSTIVTAEQINTAALMAAGTVPGTRGIVVNRAETSLWLCGAQANASGTHFILRFDKSGSAWAQNLTFVPPTPSDGRLTGCALSPDESTLFVTVANPNDATQSRVMAFKTSDGSDLGFDYTYYPNTAGGDFQPVGIATSASDANHNAQTSYNLFVSGFRTFAAAVSSANSIAIVAPKDNGSADKTRADFFDVVLGATAVSVTGGPTVSSLTDTTATITWTTDFRSGTLLHYGGAAGTYNMPDASVPETTTEHSVTLTNLAPGVTYYFQVESKRDPLMAATATGSFTTQPRLRIDSETLTATTSSAALVINTNAAADVLVHWGDSASAFNKPDITVAGGTAHTVNFTGLAPGATYYYQVVLSGANAIGMTSTTSAFTAVSDGGVAGSFTDSNLGVAHSVDLVVAPGSVSLPIQGVPGIPVSLASLPTPVYDGGVVAYNHYLYVIGGADSTGVATANVYYIKINTDGTLDSNGWQTSATPLPAARAQIGGMVTAYNGRVYVAGGLDASATAVNQNTVLYAAQNPTTGDLGPWQGLDTGGAAVNPMPAARYRGTASVMDGYLLVSGGILSGVPQSTDFAAPFLPDGSLGAWFDAGPLNDARFLHRTVVNNHTVLSIGGQNALNAPLPSVDAAYVQPNGDLTAFTRATSYPGHADSIFDLATGRRGIAADLVAGKLVTAGGELRDVISGDVNGTKLISFARLASDNLPQAWTDAATIDSGAVLANNLTDTDGAGYNATFYVAGGRAANTLGSGASSSDTAVTDVLGIPMNPDPSDAGYATSGTLESRVLDLGALTNLKHISVAGSGLSNVAVRYRFAGGAGAWSDWYTAAAEAEITGAARYFQYQLVLKGGASTPTVTSVTLTTAAGAPGPITTADVKRALSLAAGLEKATASDMARLNVDGVGGITVLDAVKLQRTVTGH